jgi:hypothetical protein
MYVYKPECVFIYIFIHLCVWLEPLKNLEEGEARACVYIYVWLEPLYCKGEMEHACVCVCMDV